MLYIFENLSAKRMSADNKICCITKSHVFNWREDRQRLFFSKVLQIPINGERARKRDESFRVRKNRSTKHVYNKLDRVRGHPLHNRDILAIIYIILSLSLSLLLEPSHILLKPVYEI